jgi:hypothetical protein
MPINREASSLQVNAALAESRAQPGRLAKPIKCALGRFSAMLPPNPSVKGTSRKRSAPYVER